jgi:hypothetical protein
MGVTPRPTNLAMAHVLITHEPAKQPWVDNLTKVPRCAPPCACRLARRACADSRAPGPPRTDACLRGRVQKLEGKGYAVWRSTASERVDEQFRLGVANAAMVLFCWSRE